MKFSVSGTDDQGHDVSVSWEDGALAGTPDGVASVVEAAAGAPVPRPIPGLEFDPADPFSTAAYLRQIFFPEIVRAKDVSFEGDEPEPAEPLPDDTVY